MVTTRRGASSQSGSGGGGSTVESSRSGTRTTAAAKEQGTPTSRRKAAPRRAAAARELDPVQEETELAQEDEQPAEDERAAGAADSQDEDEGGAEAADESGDEEEEENESDDDEDDALELMAATMRAHCSKKQTMEAPADIAEDEDEDEDEPPIHSWKAQTLLPPSVAAAPDEAAAAQFIPGGSKSLYAPPADLRKAAREAAKKAPKTKGSKWFDLPAQTLDDDTKRELRLIRLRGAYDPKRFYKGFDSTKLPTYFQVGTVVNGPADHYTGRLSKSEARNTSVTQQLLKDNQVHNYRKKRYAKMQEESQRWSGPNKRSKKMAGEGSNRVKKRKPKPKH